jgi:hypothetical protein
VKQLKEARITEILQDKYGVVMGSLQMLERYQEVVTEAVEELSRDEIVQMKKIAVEWTEKSVPDSAKARCVSMLFTKIIHGIPSILI